MPVGCITIGERLSVEGANGVVHSGTMKVPLLPSVGGTPVTTVDFPVALKVCLLLDLCSAFIPEAA